MAPGAIQVRKDDCRRREPDVERPNPDSSYLWCSSSTEDNCLERSVPGSRLDIAFIFCSTSRVQIISLHCTNHCLACLPSCCALRRVLKSTGVFMRSLSGIRATTRMFNSITTVPCSEQSSYSSFELVTVVHVGASPGPTVRLDLQHPILLQARSQRTA